MMDSNAVARYIAEHKLGETKEETETQVAPAEEVETKVEPSNASNDDSTAEPKPSDPNNVEDKTEDTKPVEEVETKQSEDINVENKEHKPEITQQDKVNHAFQKQKAKQKRLEARIRELEKQNEELSKRNPADIKDNSELIDFIVSRRMNEAETKKLKEEYQSTYDEEFAAINEERIRNCFPDQIEQDKYNSLIQTNGPKLLKTLDEEDPEHAVLSYLDDSDIAPLLIRILMTSDKYRNEVLKFRSPYGKYNALDKLAEKVQMAREQMAKETKSTVPVKTEETKPVEQVAKPAIPVIGSVTKSENEGVSNKVIDYNQILHQMNQKRGYGGR